MTEWTLVDGVDGHVTRETGVLLTVTVADCVPVYLFSPDTGDLGLLHAGWRGVAADILEKGLDELARAGARRQSVVVHLGPAICGSCYEVGPEVARQLGAESRTSTCVDLRGILAHQAADHGVERITTSQWCTFHDRQFHSYRRDGDQSGRMAAFLGRESAIGA